MILRSRRQLQRRYSPYCCDRGRDMRILCCHERDRRGTNSGGSSSDNPRGPPPSYLEVNPPPPSFEEIIVTEPMPTESPPAAAAAAAAAAGVSEDEQGRPILRRWHAESRLHSSPAQNAKKRRQKICWQLLTPALTLTVVLIWGIVNVTRATVYDEAFTQSVAEKLQARILGVFGMSGGDSGDSGGRINCTCVEGAVDGGNGTGCPRNDWARLSAFVRDTGQNTPLQTLILTPTESNFVELFKPRLKLADGSVLKIGTKALPTCGGNFMTHILSWTLPKNRPVQIVPPMPRGDGGRQPPAPPDNKDNKKKKGEEEDYDDTEGSGGDSKEENWGDEDDPGPEAGRKTKAL